MKKIIYGIALFFTCFSINILNVMCFDWSNDQIIYGEQVISKDSISTYSDRNKQIDQVCLYAGEDREVQTVEGYNNSYVKYLFIYKDGTASMGWNGSWCKRGNGGSTCADGYKSDKQGLRNWSKNSTGVKNDAVKKYDAYASFQKEKKCPRFVSQAENYGENYFYLYDSTSNSMKSYADKEPGGNTYLLYNVGEANNITSDLSCDYALTKDGDNAFVGVTFKKNSYVSVNAKFTEPITVTTDGEGPISSVNITVKPQDIFFNNRLYSTSYLERLTDGKCPKVIKSCVYSYATGGGIGSANADLHYVLYGDPSVALDTYCDGNENAQIDIYCIGDNCSTTGICENYDVLIDNLETVISGYSSASSVQKKDILNEYNQKKDELNSFCVSALSNLNYSEGGCLEKCLKNAELIAEIEKANGLRTDYDDKAKCGIGTSIVNMVYNVLKWAKYIAPALVIILTMLDFIKAIAAQNDDDMKKAQGKFVKRLIVAALLFLLPLIINFILQTFGLYDSSCDITDLF